jgi:hypothetical protein
MPFWEERDRRPILGEGCCDLLRMGEVHRDLASPDEPFELGVFAAIAEVLHVAEEQRQRLMLSVCEKGHDVPS